MNFYVHFQTSIVSHDGKAAKKYEKWISPSVVPSQPSQPSLKYQPYWAAFIEVLKKVESKYWKRGFPIGEDYTKNILRVLFLCDYELLVVDGGVGVGLWQDASEAGVEPSGHAAESGTTTIGQRCWREAIFTMVLPPDRNSSFTMWVLLTAVLLVLLPVVLLLLLLAVLFALFGHGEWVLNGTCVGFSFPTLLLVPTAKACCVMTNATVAIAVIIVSTLRPSLDLFIFFSTREEV